MPVVEADGRLLYDGPSLEDAELVAELAKELGAYRRLLLFSPKRRSSVPRGLCGKELARMEQADRRHAVREALMRYKEGLKAAVPRNGRGWNNEPSPHPPKHVVKNLLASSVAKSFEEARREWHYSGDMVEEGERGFSRECDLCGPKEQMRHNFVIRNVRTGKTLQVGSVCVKRFLVLAGTSSPEESAAVFDHRTALAVFGRSLRNHIGSLALEPVPEKSLVAIVGALEKSFPRGMTEEEADIVLRAAEVDARAAQIFKAIVVKDAAALRGLKVRQMRDREEKRRRVGKVLTTLCRSKAYRVGI